jgi:hypothetical protein
MPSSNAVLQQLSAGTALSVLAGMVLTLLQQQQQQGRQVGQRTGSTAFPCRQHQLQQQQQQERLQAMEKQQHHRVSP